MKAAFWYNKKDMRIEEIDEPSVPNDSVKIKVKWCGICGSDLHEYAKRAGADIILDPNEVDVVSKIMEITGGVGVDAAFETTGSEIGFTTAFNIIKSDGTLVITSLWESEIKFNPNFLVFFEKKIVGTMGYRNNYPTTITHMNNGNIKTEGWITKKIHLDDIVEEGFETLCGPDKKNHVKILVTPDKSLL